MRSETRARSVEDIAASVVGEWRGAPVTLAQVAGVAVAGAPRRGTGSAGGRQAVILTVQRNPEANTLRLIESIDRVLDDLEKTLPAGIRLERRPGPLDTLDFERR